MNDNREEQLERLFAAYVDRLNAGEKLDADAILAENPFFGEELLVYLDQYLDVASNGHSNEPLGTLGDYTLRRQIGRGGDGGSIRGVGELHGSSSGVESPSDRGRC